MLVDVSTVHLRRLENTEAHRIVEIDVLDQAWIGSPMKVRAETELLEDGHLIVEIETASDLDDLEVGGVSVSAERVVARMSASLSPDEARALAGVLMEFADFLSAYQLEIERAT